MAWTLRVGWLAAESSSTPFGLIVLLTPSLFLGTAFAILMVSVHYNTSEDERFGATSVSYLQPSMPC